jgi:hypothetical protein
MLGSERQTIVPLDAWTAYTVNVTIKSVTIKTSSSTNAGYNETVEPWDGNICYLESGNGESKKLPWGDTTFRTNGTGTVVPEPEPEEKS